MCSKRDTLPDLGDPGPLLADYLDHLCAPLIGVMPYARRMDLRLEIQLHITSLAQELGEQDPAPEDALAAAMREFGEPWIIGEGLLRHAVLDQEVPCSQRARPATEHGVAWLGLPSALCLALVTRHTMDDSPPLLLPLLILLTLMTPVVGGALTGFTAPSGAEVGVLRAMAFVSLFSLGVAVILLPSLVGLGFLGIQLAFGLPAGWLSARAAITARRQYRRSRFLRLASGQSLCLPEYRGV